MPSNRCIVVGCNTTSYDKVTPRHRFPKDEDMLKIWVQKSGNNKLLNKSADVIYNSYLICDKHFENSYKVSFKRLIKDAVPTLNLPGKNNFQNV